MEISMTSAAERKKKRGPAEYLKAPYARIVVPEDDGTFRAEILEFPGCLATGKTPGEALERIEVAAESWIESALAQGQPIPVPVESHGFSGKLVLRLPRSLHRKAARYAERDGVSLNQFIVVGLAERLGERAVARAMVPLTVNLHQHIAQIFPDGYRTASTTASHPSWLKPSSEGLWELPQPHMIQHHGRR